MAQGGRRRRQEGPRAWLAGLLRQRAAQAQPRHRAGALRRAVLPGEALAEAGEVGRGWRRSPSGDGASTPPPRSPPRRWRPSRCSAPRSAPSPRARSRRSSPRCWTTSTAVGSRPDPALLRGLGLRLYPRRVTAAGVPDLRRRHRPRLVRRRRRQPRGCRLLPQRRAPPPGQPRDRGLRDARGVQRRARPGRGGGRRRGRRPAWRPRRPGAADPRPAEVRVLLPAREPFLHLLGAELDLIAPEWRTVEPSVEWVRATLLQHAGELMARRTLSPSSTPSWSWSPSSWSPGRGAREKEAFLDACPGLRAPAGAPGTRQGATRSPAVLRRSVFRAGNRGLVETGRRTCARSGRRSWPRWWSCAAGFAPALAAIEEEAHA